MEHSPAFLITDQAIQKQGEELVEWILNPQIAFWKTEGTFDLGENSIDKAKTEVKKNGEIILKLDQIQEADLPKISLLTPTSDRHEFFSGLLDNYHRLNYPREKIEWLILDNGVKSVKKLLPLDEDPRIKYVRCNPEKNGKLEVGRMRNILSDMATGEILINLDDDDYYFSHHALAKVKVLTTYPEKNCCGSLVCGTYDLMKKESYNSVRDANKENGKCMYFHEASMAFRKSFWENGKWGEVGSEVEEFLNGRESELIDFPYSFNMIIIRHGNNSPINGKGVSAIRMEKGGRNSDYWKVFDETFKRELKEIRTGRLRLGAGQGSS